MASESLHIKSSHIQNSCGNQSNESTVPISKGDTGGTCNASVIIFLYKHSFWKRYMKRPCLPSSPEKSALPQEVFVTTRNAKRSARSRNQRTKHSKRLATPIPSHGATPDAEEGTTRCPQPRTKNSLPPSAQNRSMARSLAIFVANVSSL